MVGAAIASAVGADLIRIILVVAGVVFVIGAGAGWAIAHLH